MTTPAPPDDRAARYAEGHPTRETLPRWLNDGIASMTERRPRRTAAGALSGRLDYNWWASNGPTGGYLVRLALEAVGRLPGPSRPTHPTFPRTAWGNA